ncbi:Protein of uncharacterised function, DUF393 [Shewanella putrefaciens]|nr:Protein of uncharacterised function, DUF393 [Shewanella putrefaciens]
MELRIFYDGNCPLCSAEMRQLKARDPKNLIALEDLNAPDFSERFSHIDKDFANTRHSAPNSGINCLVEAT